MQGKDTTSAGRLTLRAWVSNSAQSDLFSMSNSPLWNLMCGMLYSFATLPSALVGEQQTSYIHASVCGAAPLKDTFLSPWVWFGMRGIASQRNSSKMVSTADSPLKTLMCGSTFTFAGRPGGLCKVSND